MAYTFTNYDTDWHDFDWSTWLWLAIASAVFLITLYALIYSGTPVEEAAVAIENTVP